MLSQSATRRTARPTASVGGDSPSFRPRCTEKPVGFQERTKTSNYPYKNKVLCLSTGASKYCCASLVENKYIYANSICVVTNSSYPLFACLSSDIHAIWAFEHGSRLHERLRYTHGDIFETFPFPNGVLEDDHPALSEVGPHESPHF
jgi:hypothetical protein